MKSPERHEGGLSKKVHVESVMKGVLATAALCVAQVFAVTGCAGTIKPSGAESFAAGNVETDCEEVMEDNSPENSDARVECMKENGKNANKTCAQLQNEETTAENVQNKIDCIEYKFKTDPPAEGVKVLSWH